MSALGIEESRAHRALTSSLHPTVLGMPAPVWTMVLWQFVGAFLVGMSTVVFAPAQQNVPVKLGIVVFGACSAIVLLMLGRRTPTALLHQLMLLNVLAGGALVAVAPTAVGAIGNSIGFVSVAIYAAFWGSRALTATAIAASAAIYLLAIIVSGRFQLLLISVLTITVVCIGIAWVIRYLVDGLDRLAMLDPLTGLMNRRGLEAALARPRRRPLAARALVAIDLDGFKQVNDRHGHAAGDELLRRLGVALSEGLRSGDAVARIGGDEFVIVLNGIDRGAAEQVLHRLRQAAPVEWAAGVVDWPEQEPLEAALARADAELYRQKRPSQS